MRIRISVFCACLYVLSACSGPEAIEPCDLLTLDEVRRFAPEADQYAEFPAAEGWGDYRSCTWLGPDLHNTVHLYYYPVSSSISAMDFVEKATANSQVSIRIIAVDGVGQSAAAALTNDSADPTGTLKIFAAESEKGTIGFRLWGIRDEKDPRLETFKEIVSIALSRL